MARPSARGFTLIEIAVVLGIVGILLTIGIAALSALSINQSASETRKKQDAIRDALIAYLGRNGRLPCPDTDVPPDGRGDNNRTTPGNPVTLCGPAGGAAPAVAFGRVPFAELGLNRESVVDGWQNLFTYYVANTPPANWTTTYDPIGNATGFRAGMAGSLTIVERTFPAGGPVATNLTTVAPVAIISHGINGSGAMTVQGTTNVAPLGTDELANLDGDAVIVRRQVAEQNVGFGAFGAFDDLVAYYSPSDLVNPVTQSGALKSAAAELNQTIAETRNYVLSYAGQYNCLPPVDGLARPRLLPPTTNYVLPWPGGGSITYARITAGALSTVPGPVPGAVGYSLSYTAEDLTVKTINVSIDEFQAQAQKTGAALSVLPGTC